LAESTIWPTLGGRKKGRKIKISNVADLEFCYLTRHQHNANRHVFLMHAAACNHLTPVDTKPSSKLTPIETKPPSNIKEDKL